MSETTKQKWDLWELIAIKYLKSKNYKILDTNFKFWRFWEIDIIAKNKEKIIFIEVKYRENLFFWTPEEAVTKSKLKKLKGSIEFYLMKNNYDFENTEFNVIAILKQEKSYKITHYKNLEI